MLASERKGQRKSEIQPQISRHIIVVTCSCFDGYPLCYICVLYQLSITVGMGAMHSAQGLGMLEYDGTWTQACVNISLNGNLCRHIERWNVLASLCC